MIQASPQGDIPFRSMASLPPNATRSTELPQQQCRNENQSGREVLPIGINPHEVHRIRHQSNEERGHESTQHGGLPAPQRRATDHHDRDGTELQPRSHDSVGGTQHSRQEDCSGPSQDSGDDESNGLHTSDGEPRHLSRTLIATDGPQRPPKVGMLE